MLETETAPRPARRAIEPRNPPLEFENVPRLWFADNVAATHVANGVNLLFPAGERFFVRAVHHYADRITDPELRAQVRGFSQQEGRHAKAHEDFFAQLERNGYRVDRFVRGYTWVGYRGIERATSPKLRLATTAALEHFTAILAEVALRERFLDQAHPAMRDLLLWHASEEIEHRAVAFDVMQQVAPSYLWRVAGMGMAIACLGGFWAGATGMLFWQDRRLGWRRIVRDAARMARTRGALGRALRHGVRDYLRAGFHPASNPIDHLATDYLASVAL